MRRAADSRVALAQSAAPPPTLRELAKSLADATGHPTPRSEPIDRTLAINPPTTEPLPRSECIAGKARPTVEPPTLRTLPSTTRGCLADSRLQPTLSAMLGRLGSAAAHSETGAAGVPAATAREVTQGSGKSLVCGCETGECDVGRSSARRGGGGGATCRGGGGGMTTTAARVGGAGGSALSTPSGAINGRLDGTFPLSIAGSAN